MAAVCMCAVAQGNALAGAPPIQNIGEAIIAYDDKLAQGQVSSMAENPCCMDPPTYVPFDWS